MSKKIEVSIGKDEGIEAHNQAELTEVHEIIVNKQAVSKTADMTLDTNKMIIAV